MAGAEQILKHIWLEIPALLVFLIVTMETADDRRADLFLVYLSENAKENLMMYLQRLREGYVHCRPVGQTAFLACMGFAGFVGLAEQLRQHTSPPYCVSGIYCTIFLCTRCL